MKEMTKHVFCVLSELSVSAAGAAVSDFTRTVVSTKLNGWEGVQFIRDRWGQTLRNARKHGGWRGLRGLRQG